MHYGPETQFGRTNFITMQLLSQMISSRFDRIGAPQINFLLGHTGDVKVVRFDVINRNSSYVKTRQPTVFEFFYTYDTFADAFRV